MTQKKPARTEATTKEVGFRLTKRTQTRTPTAHGHEVVVESLDPDDRLNLQRFKAKAIALLRAEGIEAEPIEFALERVRSEPGKGNSRNDDSLLGVAGQSLLHIHQLELIEAHIGKIDSRAAQHTYSLGRLSVLMRYLEVTLPAAKKAALQRVPGSIEIDDGDKVTKEDLVREAIAAAGEGERSPAAWDQLFGILDSKGLDPVESGAKDERVIKCQSPDITFNYAAFKTMVSRIKSSAGQGAARGRPKKKLHQRR